MRLIDLGLATVLAVAVAAVVEAYPRSFVIADEGILLYEAQRILEGDVPYRDYFSLFGVGSEWLFAALFRLCGTTFSTARDTMAVLHGVIAIQIFALARAVGVRRLLALTAAAVHPAVALPQFAMATPHWFGTALLLAAWHALLAMGRRHRAVDGLLTGSLVAALIFVEHPKGLATFAAIAALLVLCSLGRVSVPSLRRAMRGYAAGFLGAVGTIGVPLVARSGVGPVWDGLVVNPLRYYHTSAINRPSWRNIFVFLGNPFEPHPFVAPVIHLATSWLPLAVLVPAAALLRALARGWGIPWTPLVLVAAEASALAGIAYNPNPAHLATILPMTAVVAAYAAERALARLPLRAPYVRWASALLLAGLALQAAHFPRCRARWTPETVDTAFGPLAGGPGTTEATRQLEAALDQTGSRLIFAYPFCPGVYLITGTRNATRFQFLLPGESPPEHFREAADVLERARVPLVLACWSVFGSQPNDPVQAVLAARYEGIGRNGFGRLYRRRADASGRE
jgi:hypothetical protein